MWRRGRERGGTRVQEEKERKGKGERTREHGRGGVGERQQEEGTREMCRNFNLFFGLGWAVG